MYIWKGKFENWFNLDDEEPQIIEHEFDDRSILLDCVADTQFDVYLYMLHACTDYAIFNNLRFIGFEIIAE